MDLLSDLNEPQKTAVTHMDGPLLVLAGAGSGKTRVITRRVAWLIQQGVAPWQILAITFTNKAAGEMRERVEKLGCARGAMLATFHALCARLLREFSAEARLSHNYTVYDRSDQLKLVKEIMGRLDLQTANFTPAKVHSTISNAKNEMKMPEDFEAGAGDYYTRAVAPIYREYQKALQLNNALDFDDLLLKTAFLLRDFPQIRVMLGQRYRYILIDEYQDTNRAQYIIAHGIAMDHENICATGDPDQSIYAWRGADINNILDFEKDYPTAKVIRLEENYRSTNPILAAASSLIKHNTQRKEKALWTRRQGGADVHVVVCDDEHSETQQIVRRIQDFHRRGGEYSGVAVFYRVNSLSRRMEEGLLKAAIPYRVARGVEFYNRKEIKDSLAYLKLLVNPTDDLSCARVINVPARKIGETTIGRLQDYASAAGMSLLEACRHGEKAGLGAAAAKKTAEFASMISSLAGNIQRPVKDVMEEMLKVTGLRESVEASDEEDAQASSNIDELVSTAAEFDEENAEATLPDYLHQISLVSDVDHMEGGSGAVTLMTMHAAKGLEFPAVFIIGCENGLLPFDRGDSRNTVWASGPSAELEEERRLAFVGMTRAMNELTLSCARRRMIRGQTLSQTASMFLSEIGQDNVAVEDTTSPAPRIGEREMSEHFGQRASTAGPRRGGFYSEMDERAVIEAMQDQVERSVPPEYEYIKVGSTVRHPMFGVGRITKIGDQPWPNTRVEVFFQKSGPKKLVLAQAKLELFEE